MASLQPLHPTQKKILKLLKDGYGEELTMRDLQEKLGLSSPSIVHHHLTQLEKKGYLRRNPSNPYDYQILATTPEKKIAYINAYGMAQCGPNGSIFDGNPIERIPISTKILGLRAEDAFIVKAKGTSMTPKVNPGDYVIAQKTPQFQNGNMVVCVNKGEVLIKKIQTINDSNGKQYHLLISLNENEYKPFVASEDFRVEGIVKGVLTYKI